MTDINEWNIAYTKLNSYAVDYDFGALSDDSPFSVQVEMGDADMANYDSAHGTEDAVLMGYDQVLARDVIFSLTTLPAASGVKSLVALDKVSEFEAVWRADGLRRVPGNYAILTNKLRNRYTIGRPRNFSPKHARMRKGIIEYVASFRTITPYWYGLPERDLVAPRTVSTAATIGGDVIAWPIITLTGPFTTATLNWNPGAFLDPWTITLSHALTSGQFVRIDTRPSSRGVVDQDGLPRNGWLTGDKISAAWLNPASEFGPGHFLFTTTGSTSGVTKCEVNWFDTYAGL